MRCGKPFAWLRWALCLALACSSAVSSWGQEAAAASPFPSPLELQSYELSEIYALSYLNLDQLELQSRMDYLRTQSFVQAMLESNESLMLEMLSSERSERRSTLALQTVSSALDSSERSLLSLSDDLERLTAELAFWRTVALVAAAISVTGAVITLAK